MLKATFKIVSGNSVWGSINGNIDDQTDLINKLDSITGGIEDEISALSQTVSENYNTLDGKIDSTKSDLNDTITANYNTLNEKIDTTKSDLNDTISANYNTLDDKIDTTKADLNDTISANYATLDDKIDINSGLINELNITLSALGQTVIENYNTLDDKIDVHIGDKANPHEVTATQVGLGNCNNTSDLDKPISTATQTALDGKVDKLSTKPTAGTYTKLTINNEGQATAGTTLSASDIPALELTKISDVTSTATEVNQLHESGAVKADFEKLHGLSATATELNYVDGVTSSIQTQINSKQATITGAATTVTANDLTVSRAVISNANGKIAVSDITSTELGYLDNVTSNIQTQFNDITDLIPTQATTSNKLADKAFVNSSISTNTANFIGTFNSVADLEAYTGTVTNNDYAFVITTDSLGNSAYDRYKYTTATTPASWVFEYELNNSSFTSDQWAAINSGATTTNIGLISTHTSEIADINTRLSALGTAANYDASSFATSAQGTKADSAVQTVTTGSANGTIAVDGTDVSVYGLGSAAYTASSSYATSTQGGKADSAIQTVKVNGSALTPDANKAVDVSVPTKISNLTDDTSTYPVDKADTLTGLTASITELNYVDGVTSAIQTQIDNKVAKNTAITGATKCKITYDSKGLVTSGGDLQASDIPSLNLSKISDVTASASELNILDGATLTTTELNYVDGVTSSIQTQLNAKQTIANLVTSVSSASTDTQYPSAKLFYDTCGDIETLINAL